MAILKSPPGALLSGLELLEIICNQDQAIGVSELARLANQDKGNVHRTLAVLASRGFIEQNRDTKKYIASSHVLTLARTLLGKIDIIDIARPFMKELASVVNESVHLAQRTINGGVYVAQERQRGRFTVETEIGASPILHATATGKALFCYDNWIDVENFLNLPLEKFTKFTITSATRFEQELKAVREQGFATDNEELNLDIRCAAAPIFDHSGSVIASIGISGPSSRIDTERLNIVGNFVLDAANKITIKGGGHIPTEARVHLQTT
jgi:DNA-binding IclR family transcriptional regulator